MQAIAAENNLSETAFTVPSDRNDADYELRWFTPAAEVELCGHATIASGHVLIHSEPVRFATVKAGVLTVSRRDDLLELDMRAANLSEAREPALCRALGLAAESPVWLADGYNDAAIIEVADQDAVLSVKPDFAALKKIRRMAVVTAPGREQTSPAACSFLTSASTRIRSPARPMLRSCPIGRGSSAGANSTHYQASARTGVLHCRLEGERAVLGGRCHTVIVGQFQL